MRSVKPRIWLALMVCAVFPALLVGEFALIHMDLEAMTERADKIFRGTVLDFTAGTVTAGGGAIPTVTYRLRVDESFKGEADMVKEDVQIVEIKMVGTIKPQPAAGDVQRLSVLRDIPRLQVGSDYLLFTTAPSSAGLSTTVGLGQGAFRVFSRNKEDFAVNAYQNVGLGFSGTGPVSYSELTASIQAALAE